MFSILFSYTDYATYHDIKDRAEYVAKTLRYPHEQDTGQHVQSKPMTFEQLIGHTVYYSAEHDTAESLKNGRKQTGITDFPSKSTIKKTGSGSDDKNESVFV